jgi:hypothetical protein
MPRSRKSRAKHIEPPNRLMREDDSHTQTPQKAGIFAVKLFCQMRGIPQPSTAELLQITGVLPRAQQRAIQSNECRTKHNQVNEDPRGRKRLLDHEDTQAIVDVLTDERTPLYKKGYPWLSLGDLAHIKAQTGCWRTVQRAVKQDFGVINAICEEEKLLDKG